MWESRDIAITSTGRFPQPHTPSTPTPSQLNLLLDVLLDLRSAINPV